MKYIANSFSLGMVPRELLRLVRFAPVDAPDSDCTSIVGHADTAAILGVHMNRQSVTLAEGDVVFVAQLQGARLPEGATTLPGGSSFAWVRVEL